MNRRPVDDKLPACASWPVPSDILETSKPWSPIVVWQDYRCAICGLFAPKGK